MNNPRINKYMVSFFVIIFLCQNISAQHLIPFISVNGKYGCKNTVGKEVVQAIYDYVIFDEASGLVIVKLNNKYGFINKDGTPVTDIKYDNAFSCSDGLCDVQLNQKWGYIDTKGKEVIPLIYDRANFSGGLCLVKLNNKYGYTDSKGKEVIPLIYDDASLFSDGLARVKKDDKFGIIDKTGKVIVPFKYDNIFGFKNGRAGVVLDFKYGFIDKKGNEIVPVKSLYYLKARLASDPSCVISFTGDFPSAYLFNRFCLGDTLQIKRPIFRECPYCSGFGTFTTNEKTVYEKVEVEHVQKIGTITQKTKSHMEYYDKNGRKYYPVSTSTYDEYGLVKSTVLIPQKIADKFVCPLVSESEHEKRKKDNSAGNYYLHEFMLIWNFEVEEYYAYPIKRAKKSAFSLTTD